MLTNVTHAPEACIWPIWHAVYDYRSNSESMERGWGSAAELNGRTIVLEHDLDDDICALHQPTDIDHYGHPTNEVWCLECCGFAWSPAPKVCAWDGCWCRKEKP